VGYLVVERVFPGACVPEEVDISPLIPRNIFDGMYDGGWISPVALQIEPLGVYVAISFAVPGVLPGDDHAAVTDEGG
jgi:hypothetical protein